MLRVETNVSGQPCFARLHAVRSFTGDCTFGAYGLWRWWWPLSPPPSSKRDGGLRSRCGRRPAALPPLLPPPLLLLAAWCVFNSFPITEFLIFKSLLARFKGHWGPTPLLSEITISLFAQLRD